MNLGVLAPALSEIWPERARAVWSLCLLVATTRVVLLAHWASDVVTGFSLGAASEAAMRPITCAPEGNSLQDECGVARRLDYDQGHH
jgi:undecaprenyl-diphosphatase